MKGCQLATFYFHSSATTKGCLSMNLSPVNFSFFRKWQ